MGASSNHVCDMCPTVVTGEARPSLLGHPNSDGTTVMGRLPVTIEGYRPSVQRHIVVLYNPVSDFISVCSTIYQMRKFQLAVSIYA
jgi:hypothetical protein